MNFQPMKDLLDRLTAWRIPGNSIRVTVEGREVFSYRSGYEDVEKKTRVRSDALYNIYSCTKPVTVTAALALYEKGYFLLDDPLYDFIPEFRHVTVKQPNGEITPAATPITLRHLFTMSAGLTYVTSSPAFAKARELTEGRMDTLTVIRCLAEDPLAFEPGTRWQYSLCHDVLAAVCEVISGKKFRDYVKESIFDPLGITEAYFHNDAVVDRVATLYRYENSKEQDLVKLQSAADNRSAGYLTVVTNKVPTHVYGPEYDSGGAGLTTTLSDYSKFAAALANGGLGQNGERILSPGTVELLRTNQLTREQLVNFNWRQLRGYGYGLGVRTMVDIAAGGSTGSLGEFGWGGAAGATLLVDPDRRVSMVYAHHMLNPQEEYYQPRLRNVLYTCLDG